MDDSFELLPELKASVNRFAFGCAVDNQTIVDHFSSDSELNNFEITESLAVFQNYRKRVLIQLTAFQEKPQQMGSASDPEVDIWTFSSFEFSVNYSQIKSIDFKDNKLFLKLLFPPILYTVCEEVDNEYDSDFIDVNEESNESMEPLSDSSVQSNPKCVETDPKDGNNSDTDGFESGIEDLSDEWDLLCEEFDENVRTLNDSSDEYEIQPNDGFNGFRLRTTQLFGTNEEIFTKINSLLIEIKDNSLMADIVSNIKAFDPMIVIQEKDWKSVECKAIPMNPIPVFGLPFDIEYSLQALTNYSFQLIDSLVFKCNQTFDEFIDLVKELTQLNEKSAEYALNELRKKFENNLEVDPIEDLRQCFDGYKDQKQEKWRNSSVVSVRRCVLTPTRMILLPALPLQQNRFLRISDPNYVIRVLIKDENFQSLSFTTCMTWLPEEHQFVRRMQSFLTNIISNRLEKGIEIAGRTYELVGASTSQLRDHGLVMYARDGQNRDAQQIRRLIGELNNIRNPAKLIARIGLSMSQSMAFVPNVDCIGLMDDIIGGMHPKTEEPYIFSDGVGMISESMAQDLCAALRIGTVSAFQIRFAGFKGILVLNPKLEGKQILLRPSMKKFESDSTDLDVLKVSEPRSCYLNRPLIAILNHLGVANEELMKLLFSRHKQLANAFASNSNAIQLIRDYSDLRLDFKELLDSGLDVLSDPFFVSIIESIVTKVSLDLRNKARILVPFDWARVMYGVLDETNTLDYGQVFVQYSHRKSGTKRVLTGQVLVTKYPCMHAGDVRKLDAIDVPALHHIFDCIVFPARGHRPHPDEMAGSDLDGDEYSVVWYKPLLFARNNFKPMDFPSGEAEDLGRTVTTFDILSFYCRFIANNQVGLIASSHLVWADAYAEGILSGVCIELDYRYAKALDYAKTGQNARLSNSQKPNKYPDFMMKYNEKPTYESKKALGKLYQKSCYFYEIINEFSQQNCVNFEVNPKLLDTKSDIYMNGAKDMFELYRKSIKDLKEKFGIESESELLSATFSRTHKYLSTHNDNNDIHDLIANIAKQLFSDFREEFESGVETDDQRLAKASAWYQISHQMNSKEDNDKCFGFPWIVSKYLAKLWLKNSQTNEDCIQTMEVSNESCVQTTLGLVSIENCFQLFLKNAFTRSEVNFKQMKKYIEEYIQRVVQKNGCKETNIPLTLLIEIFDELSNNFDVFENEIQFDVAIVALMAKFKVQRLGLKEALKRESKMSSEPNVCNNSNKYVFISAVSDKLSQIIACNENLFKSKVTQMTGVSQMAINYGLYRRESHICVYGTRSSTEKFRKFIINEDINGITEDLLQIEAN